MTKVLRTKAVSKFTAIDGFTHETHEVELDGLPSVEVDVKVPKNVDRIKDEDARTKRVSNLAIKEAQLIIDGLVADHAG